MMGVLVNFIIGGVTGIYLADVPSDVAFHGGMFVTAHFHFTLVGGMVFGFFAGFYYWFPKMFGKQLDQTLAKLHFWLFEIGFVGTFMALFYAGIHGEPRWMAEIPPAFGTANTIASLFAILIALSVFTCAYNVIHTLIAGEVVTEANVWGGKTLSSGWFRRQYHWRTSLTKCLKLRTTRTGTDGVPFALQGQQSVECS